MGDRSSRETEPASTGAEAGTVTDAQAAAAETGQAAGTGSQSGGERDGAPEGSGTAATEEALSDIRRGCERSTLYHKAREGALDSVHRFMMAAVLVSSSGAVIAVAQASRFGTYLALIPAVFGAIDLVFAFSRQARDHAVLARQFMDLAAEACAESAATRLGEFQARFYKLASEEPPIYEAVESLCYNQVASAVGSTMRRDVPRFHRVFRHVFRFSGKKFPLVESK